MLLDDGLISFIVTDITNDEITCVAENGVLCIEAHMCWVD